MTFPLALAAMNRICQLMLLGASVFLAGCCCVRDRRTVSEVCQGHHTRMHAEVFRRTAIMTPTFGYAGARLRLFPNIPPQGPPVFWPWSRQRVYICDQCVAAEAEWSRQQPSRVGPRASLDAEVAFCLCSEDHWRRASEPER